ncbi:TonB-dependent receptor [Henriciella litoralis]|uniref:TonB-dependent receptor n=1 Tax=Henriciella litoralis TaxID=568102 RepID=UPI000A071E37|nr:TonB-dependent receptor [Henriciella litoralis]
MSNFISCRVLLLAITVLPAAPTGWAQSTSSKNDEARRLDPISVFGRGAELIGKADAASEGTVGYEDFKDRPLARVGELVEVIPGAVATQHSGEGKANQYFLRGFNLDHGTDFSASVDGIPINLRTHGHGQGYLDLNFVIPEIVERVDYRKGPYSAQAGDFAAAGSARYKTYDRLDNSFIELSIGEGNFQRGVGAANLEAGPATTLLLAGEMETYDGPWALEQDLRKLNALAKLTHESSTSRYQFLATAYETEYTSTDQIPKRAVESDDTGRFGFIDDDLGGETSRYSLSAAAEWSHAHGGRTRAQAYGVSYDFSLWSNFTYYLEDQINGDEFEQLDQRTYYGAAIRHDRPVGERLTLSGGLDARRDDISDVGLFRTAARERLSTVRRDAVTETSIAAWGEASLAITDKLRAVVGVRGDYYDAEVDAISLPENGGSANDTLASPSLAFAWQAAPGLELYANYGEGFHSNDVRGATISVDPASGEPATPVPILVKARGSEIGARWESDAVRATLALFQLDLDSELVFVGDAGSTEPNDSSTRTGIEASLFWTPAPWLIIDASAAHTDAAFDIAGPADEIPGAVGTVLSGGMLMRFDALSVSARLRHFGEAPLTENGSITSDPTTIINLGVTRDIGPVSLSLDVLNALDAKDADISYFFESRLPGETGGVEDLHFHPVEPRQLRLSARYRF